MTAPRADLHPDELAVLRDVCRRKIPGPLRRTPERDRLRKAGLIESRDTASRDAQGKLWLPTAAGLAYVASRAEA